MTNSSSGILRKRALQGDSLATHELVLRYRRSRGRRVNKLRAPRIDVSSQRIKKALERLADIDRELLLMRCVDQLGNDEIEAILGISEAEVRSKVRKALQELQHSIDG